MNFPLNSRPTKRVTAAKSSRGSRAASIDAPATSGALDAPTTIGGVDGFEEGRATGWVVDRMNPLRPVELIVYIDGRRVDRVMPDKVWEDHGSMGLHGLRVGFDYSIPLEFYDGQEHRLLFRTPAGAVLPHVFGPTGPREQHSFVLHRPSTFEGHLDGCVGGVVRGWALRKIHAGVDGTQTVLRGGLKVIITLDDTVVGHTRADLYRKDVALHFNCNPNCGFEYSLPTEWRSEAGSLLRVYVEPEHFLLPECPIAVSFPPEDTVVRLLALYESVERLNHEAERLRHEIKRLLPARSFSISDYDIWARRYYPVLRERVRAIREQNPLPRGGGPLVSILCPTYRPLLRDFEAAVASVLAQTYENWELVIVDDGSRSPELTEYMEAIAGQDSRINIVKARRNAGIAAATNLAMLHAKGEWFAFFDHDDALVDVALDVMVGAAIESGAEVLYSDEDKIDDAGRFLEPVLKPDWNHRLLLGINYVCHFLFVRREAAERAGPIDSAFDGAQDYDFILRLTETVAAERIVHVPEVLYHWRKTANSTASDIGNKPLAIAAGRRAIEAHLKRRGLAGTVSTPSHTTLYTIAWSFSQEPRVRIVIPFRDQVETTFSCLMAILELTRYDNYEVLLVDNWSSTLEAEQLVSSAFNHPKISILRVEEPFNYSRLNNLAARLETGHEAPDFFVFMNNDVFVKQPNWLRLLVDEALADSTVGAVGGKLLYTNGTVQHGGCILGVGGKAAGHVYTGALVEDTGYLGRAALAQELSAVTAACVLCRADAFEAVGGFDETELAIAFNDIDLCLKLRRSGHKVIWTPAFIAEHAESLSRGDDNSPRNARRFFHEGQAMIGRWRDMLWNDPAYNRHFDLMRRAYHDLVDPELEAVQSESWFARRGDPNRGGPGMVAKTASPPR